MTWQEAKRRAIVAAAAEYFPKMLAEHGSVLRAARAAGMGRNQFRRMARAAMSGQGLATPWEKQGYACSGVQRTKAT